MGRILIVDDNFANRQLLFEILNEQFKCDMASLGKEAFGLFVDALDKDPYDIVLLDIAMPEVSGIDVLKDIRAAEKQRNIAKEKAVSIIMCTAFKEPFVEAYKYGCDDYIMKPIDAVALLVMVTRRIVTRSKDNAQ